MGLGALSISWISRDVEYGTGEKGLVAVRACETDATPSGIVNSFYPTKVFNTRFSHGGYPEWLASCNFNL